MIITQEEHDEWHKKHKDYDEKNSKEHEISYLSMTIVVKKHKKK